ncbi:MAG: Sugar kinase, ribokinase family [Parcubacteria group bacterium GW2011_GWF1_52_5]|nr:MAG: Sugar kinase, ribokinase family [Parcubacteria group bacterium GW2011_GWF1_52_5]
MRDLDFVAIGDIVVDAFIRLTQADVYTQEGVERLCLINGAKIPYESLTVIPAVGNSPNAAVAAARLGLASGLVSDLGADEYGTECLQALAEEHVDSSLVKKHEGKRTNYHYVLWYRDERTILIKHEEYPYALPELGAVRWIYLSSLGEQSFAYHEAIAAYVETHPGTKLAFQPGTFQIKLGAKKLSALYKAKSDSQDGIAPALSADRLARALSALGPKIAVITDGPHGAYCYDSHTGTAYFMPPYPDPKPPFERTGAGDAFSSTFTAALALGKSIEEALSWAPINSMSVVQKIGARGGLLKRAELEQLLAVAPSSFIPEKR